jgi:hypothetical protein
MCYIRFDAYPNHVHIQIIVKESNLLKKKERKEKEKTEKKNTAAQIKD